LGKPTVMLCCQFIYLPTTKCLRSTFP